ncbi:MOSC domain-containing protein [Roseibium salinum]|uniref:MOSC domain-containing protein n=1 Tax=Roseibium salinum TaxID=1604349 RepID=A0ABT3R993_9HYPH|nr:MOSC domain-containing protein [Roseibium sp. DSM 29163]MCX2725871.1 MOSC domain-containing protein [Roseibium sp. DSM 29163]
MTVSANILNLFIGTPEHRWEGRAPSAIARRRADGPQDVLETGLAGDKQADLTVHGGPEKALHIYPSEHYAHWQAEFPEKARAFRPGGFGENISSEGFVEEDLCIGDIFSAGSARIQISQGRQPCWKLNMHTDNPGQAAAFQKTGKTGWYFRVLEPGTLAAGDEIALIDRPCPDWNLREVILARFDPRLDPSVALALSQVAQLAEPWRAAFARKADRDYREDTSRRLKG